AVAPRLLEPFVEGRAAVGGGPVRAVDRVVDEAVGHLPGQAGQLRLVGGDPDGDPLPDGRDEGAGEGAPVVLVELPFEGLQPAGDVALGEDLPDDLDRLLKPADRLLVAGHAVEALDPVADGRPEAEDDAAAGQPVEIHGGHGDLERVAGEGDLDAAGDLDPGGDGGAETHAHEGVAVD